MTICSLNEKKEEINFFLHIQLKKHFAIMSSRFESAFLLTYGRRK